MFSSFGLLIANLTVTLSMFHTLAALCCHFPCFTFSAHRTFQPAQATTCDCLHSSSSRYSTMDAQWQQYYRNHYLLQQQQHQQLATTEAAATHPSTSHHSYNPTGTYGPLIHHPSQSFRPHHLRHCPQQLSSFKHSPQPGAAAGSGSAPPPPPHVPSPKPPLQDSWHQTDHHWDANTLHSIEQYNLPNGHGRPVLPASQPLTSFPGNSHTTARPSIQHAPL